MTRPRRSADDGVAAVEFALVMSVLLILVFGVIDFGSAYNRKITASQAAREGARLAALGNAVSAVKTRTETAASGMHLTDSNVHVCYRAAGDTSACTGDSASPVCSSGTGDAVVTVSQVYQFITPIATFAKLSRSSLTISATGRMPCGG